MCIGTLKILIVLYKVKFSYAERPKKINFFLSKITVLWSKNWNFTWHFPYFWVFQSFVFKLKHLQQNMIDVAKFIQIYSSVLELKCCQTITTLTCSTRLVEAGENFLRGSGNIWVQELSSCVCNPLKSPMTRTINIINRL